MKIIEEREPFFVEFNQLEEGDVFRYLYFGDEAPTTFMKIEEQGRAVNLVTGRIHCFMPDVQCEPFDAKLIISPRVG